MFILLFFSSSICSEIERACLVHNLILSTLKKATSLFFEARLAKFFDENFWVTR